jgi:hypothetical protein
MIRTRTRLAKLLLTIVLLGATGCTDVTGIPPSDRPDTEHPGVLVPADSGSGSGIATCKPPCKGPQ